MHGHKNVKKYYVCTVIKIIPQSPRLSRNLKLYVYFLNITKYTSFSPKQNKQVEVFQSTDGRFPRSPSRYLS